MNFSRELLRWKIGGATLLLASSGSAQSTEQPTADDPAAEQASEKSEPTKNEASASPPGSLPAQEEEKISPAQDPVSSSDAGIQPDASIKSTDEIARDTPTANSPPRTETSKQQGEAEAENSEQEVAAETELDKTGTPPLPPRGDKLPPEEEWDKDYDGRKDKTRPEDGLIWIPRAPLYPVHLILDYGVRWPIVGAVTLSEKHHFFNRVQDFFTFDDGKAGVYPTAFYDAGRGFWGGVNFFYNDWGVEGHKVRATAAIGTNNSIIVSATDSWKIFDNDQGTLSFRGTFHRNPTFAFTGLGADTSLDDQVFFGEEKLQAEVDLDVDLDQLNHFRTTLDFRRAKLTNGRDPSIEDFDFAVEPAGFTGFKEFFFLASLEMKLDLDTRRPKSPYVAGSGFRFESWGDYNLGDPNLSFFRYGVKPSVLWDITGANHVLKAGVYTEALSRTGGESVPLNELVTLGGFEQMKAFFPGRFRGESALVYSLDYSWPLLAFADALVFSELGTTYSGFYDDFAHKNMVLDWGVGAKTTVSPEISLWGAIAFGTNQLEYWNDSFALDSVRFVVGVTRGQ